jgi:hypothetical protein
MAVFNANTLFNHFTAIVLGFIAMIGLIIQKNCGRCV